MVSAVFEDLKHRWSRQSVENSLQQTNQSNICSEYPWAAITIMVPGEADAQCARIAKLTGCAILTNDSDLLIHDLGLNGAVILLNSINMTEDTQQSANLEVRGLRLRPHEVSRRLGVVDLQQIAFTLARNPRLSFLEILRHSKEQEELTERSADYIEFLREYQDTEGWSHSTADRDITQRLDTRVSELFWQYKVPSVFAPAGEPHFYLGILHEDHSRRCAWEQGRLYRALGYSIFNLAQPTTRRCPAVHEFVRRGGRVVSERIILGDAEEVISDVNLVNQRLNLARARFSTSSQSGFWVMFALSEIYCDSTNNTTLPNSIQLEQFLKNGFMGKATEWSDIHLLAQLQTVLYSARMLRQLLDVVAEKAPIECEAILADLPPLHSLLMSRYEIVQSFAIADGMARQSVRELFDIYG